MSNQRRWLYGQTMLRGYPNRSVGNVGSSEYAQDIGAWEGGAHGAYGADGAAGPAPAPDPLSTLLDRATGAAMSAAALVSAQRQSPEAVQRRLERAKAALKNETNSRRRANLSARIVKLENMLNQGQMPSEQDLSTLEQTAAETAPATDYTPWLLGLGVLAAGGGYLWWRSQK